MEEIIDLHVYTNNSVCGHDKISLLCEIAAEKNIRAVAFTDLCRMDAAEDYDMHRRLRHSFFDICKARQLFFGVVSVFAGIEFEQAAANPEAAAAILERQTYDIVLTSVSRRTDGSDFGLSHDMPQSDFMEFCREYAALLTQTVEETDFDVLSRPLAPLRQTNADTAPFEDAMHGVLRLLAQKGKALELDTRDILGSERIRDLYLRLISYFRDCGGTDVTIGSESMFHDDVGSGITLAGAALHRVGFEHAVFFDKRLPYPISL